VAFQTGLILTLLLLPPHLDFFVALGLPLSAQALRALPRSLSFRWVGALTLAVASTLLVTHGWLDGLAFLLVYGAGYVFVASYVFVTAQAEAARAESQRLLSELQQAHRQLQDYAAQVEHLTAVDERNRLARELHDSLTQTLYSLTLQAEVAARELAAPTAAQTVEQLRTIRRMAQQALGEMRALLFELRLPDLEGVLLTSGPLRAALRRAGSDERAGWVQLLPALLSLLSVFSLFTFFTQYANAFTHANIIAGRGPDGETYFWNVAGISGVLVPAALMMGFILLATNAGLMFSLGSSYSGQHWPVLLAALAGGILADTLLAVLKPSVARVRTMRVFSFATPFSFFVLYFATLMPSSGIRWRIHM